MALALVAVAVAVASLAAPLGGAVGKVGFGPDPGVTAHLSGALDAARDTLVYALVSGADSIDDCDVLQDVAFLVANASLDRAVAEHGIDGG